MTGSSKSDSPSYQGLRTVVQTRIMNDVFKATQEKWKGWSVLILDAMALRVISTVVGMYDLMEQHISIVEDLYKKRAPYREMAAMYFLAPSEKAIDALVQDWSNPDAPPYGKAVFLYFTSKVSDALFSKIKACKPLVQRLRAFSEINVDFLATEMRAFHLDMRGAEFASLYLRQASASHIQKDICHKLVTLCATLNEYPHVRYLASSNLCVTLAQIFQQELNDFVGANPKWWYHGDGTHNERGRSTLLFLDRAEDCLSPLMHEFTYQAMVHDLLPVKDDRITYESDTASADGSVEKKDVLLNENDELWTELRTKHIAEVIKTLSGRIREIVNSNTASVLRTKGDDSKALSLSQMATALKALPEYKEVMSKLSQHMHLSHSCMDIFNRAGLLDLADLEQTLATGKTEDGRAPKVSDLVEDVEEELRKTSDSKNRLRLLAILVVSQKGMRPADRERLLSAAQLSADEYRTLQNLEKLEVPLVQTTNQNSITSMFRGQRLVASGRSESESEYATSRYVSNIRAVMEDMEASKLSVVEYPSVLPMPAEGSSSGTAQSARTKTPGSARKGGGTTQSRWARSDAAPQKRQQATFSGSRQMIFVAGGLCYSELRAAQEAMNAGEKEIILGSTRFVNPDEFLQELASLG